MLINVWSYCFDQNSWFHGPFNLKLCTIIDFPKNLVLPYSSILVNYLKYTQPDCFFLLSVPGEVTFVGNQAFLVDHQYRFIRLRIGVPVRLRDVVRVSLRIDCAANLPRPRSTIRLYSLSHWRPTLSARLLTRSDSLAACALEPTTGIAFFIHFVLRMLTCTQFPPQ